MNTREEKAIKKIKKAAGYYIQGLENEKADNQPSSDEWKEADDELKDHAKLSRIIYQMITKEDATDFANWTGKELKDIRLLGEEWLMGEIENELKKLGY